MAKGLDLYFTIIIPTLNEEDSLPSLLQDLEKQTFRKFQIIVVDGYSEDGTVQIAQKHGIKVVLSKKRNVSYQRNLGAKGSKSTWIVFMDADNRIPKTYLEKVKKVLDKNVPDILSTWFVPSTKSGKDKLSATLMNVFMDINKNSKKPYIMESMVFIRNDSFKKLGGFNPEIPWREGKELMERAKEAGMKFMFLKNPKYTYSFRRFSKVGTLQMFKEMSQMEIIKLVSGRELSKREGNHLYPMTGGSFYKNKSKTKITLQDLISLLFEDEKIDRESLKSFKKSLNSRKGLF